MKRTLSLIVLLGVVIGSVVTGCNKAEDTSTAPADTVTNAAPATP